MAKDPANTEKEGTTAPGAASTSDVQNTENQNEEKDILLLVLESNQAVIDSNNAVLESNQAVILAVASFNENASNVVKEILEEAKAAGSSKPAKVEKPKVEIAIKKGATYIVAKGRKFQSSVSGNIVEEGTELNGLEADRLKSLIAQGIAIEKEKEE